MRIVPIPGGFRGPLQSGERRVLLAERRQRGRRDLVGLREHRLGRRGLGTGVRSHGRSGISDQLRQQNTDLAQSPFSPDAFGGP
ncbi:hypothetical protein NKH18_31885 [Streptomyces sp. M10(2022)]